MCNLGIWVTPATLAAAQKLADLIGVDVEAFVDFVVNQLHDQEVSEGALRERATWSKSSDVIPINGERRRRNGIDA